ncbi:MAG: branched-chain amino acid ABC transporter permease [Solirubrobacterales bacterium]
MPSWHDFQPFIVTGLALGGVYALSGAGMVVLYRTTGVLNLAFGAVGAMSALIAWDLINNSLWPEWPSYGVAVLFAAGVTLLYGVLLGPALARRDALVKATATLGLALILLGAMSWIWSDKARSQVLPTSTHAFDIGQVAVTWTQVIAFGLGVVVVFGTAAFLQYTKLGTAMRGLANDREITATLGVPVRWVEAQAWLVSGILSGISGLLLSDLVGLDAVSLTFLVISSLAAALIARLRSLMVTFFAALVVGLVSALATPITSVSEYRNMAPFVLATIALLVISRKREISFAGTGLGNGRG